MLHGNVFELNPRIYLDKLTCHLHRLLTLMRDTGEDEDDDEAELPDGVEDNSQENGAEDDGSPAYTEDEPAGSLYFRERSFRDFLKKQDASPGILGVSPFEAHLRIMETLVHVLCAENVEEGSKEAVLVNYASWAWDWHLIQLDAMTATKDQVERVIMVFYLVLRAENKIIDRIEDSTRIYEADYDEDRPTAVRKDAMDTFLAWSARMLLVEAEPTAPVNQWLSDVRSGREHAVTWLIKKHVRNWMSATVEYAAYNRFCFAISTLREVSGIGIHLSRR